MQRSTGTDNRQKALAIAWEYESAARQMKTEAQIRRVLSDLYEKASGRPLASGTIRAYFLGWVERKKVENSSSTATKYRDAVDRFLKLMGTRADLDLNYLTSTDVVAFRETELARVGANSVNLSLKILRIVLNQAKREGLVQVNAAAQVMSLKRAIPEQARRPFTIPELKQVLAAANEEWKGMIAFGVYTGQRLSDVASLTWANVDLQNRELRHSTRKTGRRMAIPMASPLVEYLFRLPATDDPAAPLFPSAYGALKRLGRAGLLSNQFYEILVSAGLAVPRSHRKQKDGAGRAAKRTQSPLSFHSLRHTATSLLKNAGVSQAVAMEFVGHESTSISQQYTHIDADSLRRAAEKLPNILQVN